MAVTEETPAVTMEWTLIVMLDETTNTIGNVLMRSRTAVVRMNCEEETIPRESGSKKIRGGMTPGGEMIGTSTWAKRGIQTEAAGINPHKEALVEEIVHATVMIIKSDLQLVTGRETPDGLYQPLLSCWGESTYV